MVRGALKVMRSVSFFTQKKQESDTDTSFMVLQYGYGITGMAFLYKTLPISKFNEKV